VQLMPRTKTVKNLEALSTFYSGALHNVDTILNTDHGVENKINAILAASFVVLIFIADKAKTFDLQMLLGIAFLSLNIAIALISIRIKSYYTGAVSLEENFDYLKKPNEKFLLQIISDAETAFTKIEKKANRKALAYTYILIFFTSGTLFCLTSMLIKQY
jgi:hypothetical protein